METMTNLIIKFYDFFPLILTKKMIFYILQYQNLLIKIAKNCFKDISKGKKGLKKAWIILIKPKGKEQYSCRFFDNKKCVHLQIFELCHEPLQFVPFFRILTSTKSGRASNEQSFLFMESFSICQHSTLICTMPWRKC